MNTIVEAERFLTIFKAQFEPASVKNVGLQSAFKQIQGWSSLQALIVTVAIHEEWGISFTDQELRNAQTINDLFNLTVQKVNP